jgi:RNA polymerase sigma-70 factor (ECF subfamily)
MDAETCWTTIRGAARGDGAARERFSRLYLDAVTAYLAARWRGAATRADVDDAVQEVFLECFRADGALDRVTESSGSGFRGWLYGVARNVARRFEERDARRRTFEPVDPAELAAEETRISRIFDREFARTLMRRAAERMESAARAGGEAATRRVELLRLRFRDGLPIREIAARMGEDGAKVHHEYAKAREEYKSALIEEVSFHHPGPRAAAERECALLLALLE